MGIINVSLPNDGETADVADFNNPINTVVTEINGNLDNTNIKSGAAIDGAKLADASVTHAKLSLNPQTNFIVTSESTSGSGFVDLATVQSITVTVPADGNLLVLFSAQTTTAGAQLSIALSGANTLAAGNDNLAYDNGAAQIFGSHTLLTGLNAGVTVVTLKFGTAGGTAYLRRRLTVIPL